MVLGLALGFARGGVVSGKIPQFPQQGQQGPAARGRQFLPEGRLQFPQPVFQQLAGIDARFGIGIPIPLPSPILGNRGFLEQAVSFRRRRIHLRQAASHGDNPLSMPIQNIRFPQPGIVAKPFHFAPFRRQLRGRRGGGGGKGVLSIGKGRPFQQIVVLVKLKGYLPQLGQVQPQRQGQGQGFL